MISEELLEEKRRSTKGAEANKNWQLEAAFTKPCFLKKKPNPVGFFDKQEKNR